MTKNEIYFIEDWIKYHGYLFGLENIHILDGSEQEKVAEIYDKYTPLGLNIHYTATGLNGLAAELTQLMNAYKGSENFLIKLDTDEFLSYTLPATLDSDVTQNRQGHVFDARPTREHEEKKITIAEFDEFFEKLPVTGQRYKASLISWSIPKQEFSDRPCRELTLFTSPQFSHLKSFFHSDSFIEVDLGCHSGKSENNKGFIDTGLTLIHYHSTSIDDSVERARRVLLSHKYINPDDTVSEQQMKLMKLRTRKANSYHKIDLYLQHLDALQSGKILDPGILNQQHPYYRPSRTCELTLVRDTLEKIDQQKVFEQS